jgi:hypothetical protein
VNPSPSISTIRTLARASVLIAGCAVCAGPAAIAGQPSVVIKTVTDDAVAGRLVEFSLGGGLVILPDGEDKPRRFDTADVVQIVTDERPVSLVPGAARVELVGGDLLFGRVTAFGDDLVTVDTAAIGQVPVPLGRIAAWKSATPSRGLQAGRGTLSGSPGTSWSSRPKGDEDTLLLTNGDVMHGLVSAIDEHGFVVETELGEARVEHDSIVEASLVPLEPPPTHGARVRVLTTDGQRLTASSLTWSEVSLAATVFDHTALRIAPDRIARLDVLGGRWEWLTALEPISYEHTPALSLHWNWLADRNVTGTPLRVAGRTYEHGLGVHSQSSITFDLKGAYRRFVTSMGLDDQSGPYANVDVEIRIDGQLRFAQEDIAPGKLHGPIRLDVTGAKRIKLTVLFGQNADLQDRFDWIEPALIR